MSENELPHFGTGDDLQQIETFDWEDLTDEIFIDQIKPTPNYQHVYLTRDQIDEYLINKYPNLTCLSFLLYRDSIRPDDMYYDFYVNSSIYQMSDLLSKSTLMFMYNFKTHMKRRASYQNGGGNGQYLLQFDFGNIGIDKGFHQICVDVDKPTEIKHSPKCRNCINKLKNRLKLEDLDTSDLLVFHLRFKHPEYLEYSLTGIDQCLSYNYPDLFWIVCNDMDLKTDERHEESKLHAAKDLFDINKVFGVVLNSKLTVVVKDNNEQLMLLLDFLYQSKHIYLDNSVKIDRCISE